MNALVPTFRPHRRRLVAVFMSSAVFFSVGSALAQSAAPAPGSPAAPAPAPASASPANANANANANATDADESHARFRWGISALGGPYFRGGHSGGAGGVDVRLGVQLDPKFAIYAQPAAVIGGGASAGASGASASALVMGSVAAMGDLTLGDLFYVAAGPELVTGTVGDASVGTAGSSASGGSGTFFSVAARAGLALGSVKPERRKAFTIGIDFRAVFTPGGPTVMPFVGLGYEAF